MLTLLLEATLRSSILVAVVWTALRALRLRNPTSSFRVGHSS